MATGQTTAVIGVFRDRDEAQRAVDDLRRAGFADSQIGFVGRTGAGGLNESGVATHAGEGAAAGAIGGGVIGTLWGLAVAANLLPGVGPVLAGGLAAALLASAAAGAAVGGTAGVLIGLGVPPEQAGYYERALQEGRFLVTVQPQGRAVDALAILRDHSGAASQAPPAAL
jgi:hypothetical protein